MSNPLDERGPRSTDRRKEYLFAAWTAIYGAKYTTVEHLTWLEFCKAVDENVPEVRERLAKYEARRIKELG